MILGTSRAHEYHIEYIPHIESDCIRDPKYRTNLASQCWNLRVGGQMHLSLLTQWRPPFVVLKSMYVHRSNEILTTAIGIEEWLANRQVVDYLDEWIFHISSIRPNAGTPLDVGKVHWQEVRVPFWPPAHDNRVLQKHISISISIAIGIIKQALRT